MYVAVSVIAGWAINYGIDNTYTIASTEPLHVHLFPIYYAIGNKATGFFVLFAFDSWSGRHRELDQWIS
ncbi:hypothetical protein AMTR_s00025p00121500 [Amborella trichopoda]|uniref:Uncharacterized protein n=1 Tax=Amborella trichopoda TaxID=13333 RepID=W1PQT4_AMBTC|nr:hypothetical protein AMTR_s00025p00121500 [Amborella trichopoda]